MRPHKDCIEAVRRWCDPRTAQVSDERLKWEIANGAPAYDEGKELAAVGSLRAEYKALGATELRSELLAMVDASNEEGTETALGLLMRIIAKLEAGDHIKQEAKPNE